MAKDKDVGSKTGEESDFTMGCRFLSRNFGRIPNISKRLQIAIGKLYKKYLNAKWWEEFYRSDHGDGKADVTRERTRILTALGEEKDSKLDIRDEIKRIVKERNESRESLQRERERSGILQKKLIALQAVVAATTILNKQVRLQGWFLRKNAGKNALAEALKDSEKAIRRYHDEGSDHLG